MSNGTVYVTVTSVNSDVTGNGASTTGSHNTNIPSEPMRMGSRPDPVRPRKSRRCQRCNFIVASGSSHCGNCGKRAR